MSRRGRVGDRGVLGWAPGSMPGIRDHLLEQPPGTFDIDSLSLGELKSVELFWVTTDMATLAIQAAPDLPGWTPSAAAASGSGLLLWDSGQTPRVPVWAVPQRWWPPNPYGLPAQPPRLPLAGVLWSNVGHEIRGLALVRTEHVRQAVSDLFGTPQFARTYPLVTPAANLPLLLSERVMDDSRLAALDADARAVVRLLGATWLLMAQPGLTQARSLTVTRTAAPGRRGGVEPTVSIVELRRAPARPTEPGGEPGRTYKHRFVVRGYWRQQPYGPKQSQRRPVYIAAHMKGPDGAPLLDVEQVHIWRR